MNRLGDNFVDKHRYRPESDIYRTTEKVSDAAEVAVPLRNNDTQQVNADFQTFLYCSATASNRSISRSSPL